jgi:hypothetical protein
MRRATLLVLILAAAVVIGAYAGTFGPAAHWQPSTHPEDWARLGEYVGGLCVPLLLIGLFANAAALRQQLEAQRQQATLDELMHEARALSAGIEATDPADAAGAAHKLDLLAAVLSEFVSRGGDAIFLLFYRDRFRIPVRRLKELEVALNTSEWWLTESEDNDARRWRF